MVSLHMPTQLNPIKPKQNKCQDEWKWMWNKMVDMMNIDKQSNMETRSAKHKQNFNIGPNI